MSELEKLRTENANLRSALQETLWMARRYADGRMTFAPTDVNKVIDYCQSINLSIEPDSDIGVYARDGHLGNWEKDKGFTKC